MKTTTDKDNEFHCMQSEKTEEIQRSQRTMEGNQESIKETLEVMNASLSRIYKLWERQEERLNEGDKRFQEIAVFMAEKKTSNGYYEKDNHDIKEDIKVANEKRVTIQDRVTKLETGYQNLLDSNKTIIDLLKAIAVGFTVFFITFIIKTFLWGY